MFRTARISRTIVRRQNGRIVLPVRQHRIVIPETVISEITIPEIQTEETRTTVRAAEIRMAVTVPSRETTIARTVPTERIPVRETEDSREERMTEKTDATDAEILKTATETTVTDAEIPEETTEAPFRHLQFRSRSRAATRQRTKKKIIRKKRIWMKTSRAEEKEKARKVLQS